MFIVVSFYNVLKEFIRSSDVCFSTFILYKNGFISVKPYNITLLLNSLPLQFRQHTISNQTSIYKGIEEALIENSKGLVCLKDGESIIDYLSANEQAKIWSKYDRPLQLIDFVDDSIRERKEQKPIKNPYKYIVTVAEAQYWDTI